jgi:hypothetical protein
MSGPGPTSVIRRCLIDVRITPQAAPHHGMSHEDAALAGVVPIKQTPMSAIGTNSCFVFMGTPPLRRCRQIFPRRQGKIVAVNVS